MLFIFHVNVFIFCVWIDPFFKLRRNFITFSCHSISMGIECIWENSCFFMITIFKTIKFKLFIYYFRCSNKLAFFLKVTFILFKFHSDIRRISLILSIIIYFSTNPRMIFLIINIPFLFNLLLMILITISFLINFKFLYCKVNSIMFIFLFLLT